MHGENLKLKLEIFQNLQHEDNSLIFHPPIDFCMDSSQYAPLKKTVQKYKYCPKNLNICRAWLLSTGNLWWGKQNLEKSSSVVSWNLPSRFPYECGKSNFLSNFISFVSCSWNLITGTLKVAFCLSLAYLIIPFIFIPVTAGSLKAFQSIFTAVKLHTILVVLPVTTKCSLIAGNQRSGEKTPSPSR